MLATKFLFYSWPGVNKIIDLYKALYLQVVSKNKEHINILLGKQVFLPSSPSMDASRGGHTLLARAHTAQSHQFHTPPELRETVLQRLVQ